MNLNSVQNFNIKNHFLKLKFLIFIISGGQAAAGNVFLNLLMTNSKNFAKIYLLFYYMIEPDIFKQGQLNTIIGQSKII